EARVDNDALRRRADRKRLDVAGHDAAFVREMRHQPTDSLNRSLRRLGDDDVQYPGQIGFDDRLDLDVADRPFAHAAGLARSVQAQTILSTGRESGQRTRRRFAGPAANGTSASRRARLVPIGHSRNGTDVAAIERPASQNRLHPKSYKSLDRPGRGSP